MRSLLHHIRMAAAKARARRDDGSALTEFVIIIPVFIILIFWSEFFVDTGIVKLKMEEAARYAAWEMTAQRTPEQIELEVKDRWADLNSPEDMHGSIPATRSFRNISMQATISAGQPAPMTGNSPAPGSFPNSIILSALQRGLYRLSNRSVEAYVRQLGSNWKTDREYSSEVKLQVANSLFPGGHILGIFFDTTSNLPGSSVINRLNFKSTSPLLLVDTWKAWPGPYGYSGGKPNTDVYLTYNANAASAVETEISKRVGDAVFAGYGKNGILGIVGFVLQFLGLVNPVSTQTWDQGGPIVAWPGARPLHSWSPGQNSNIQRIADKAIKTGGGDDTTMLSSIQSPEPGIDRSRYTTPSRINTSFWGAGAGGLNAIVVVNSAVGAMYAPGTTQLLIASPNMNKPSINPYVTMYQSTCRDGYYMGATKSGVSRFKTTDYFKQTNPGCPGAAASTGPCVPGWNC